jgi:hypothetical protein
VPFQMLIDWPSIMHVIDFSVFCPTTTLSELSSYDWGKSIVRFVTHESGWIIVMFRRTGLLYTVELGESMIICGGSVIGGIGVADVPQVGLAPANSTTCNHADRIRRAIKVADNILFGTISTLYFIKVEWPYEVLHPLFFSGDLINSQKKPSSCCAKG